MLLLGGGAKRDTSLLMQSTSRRSVLTFLRSSNLLVTKRFVLNGTSGFTVNDAFWHRLFPALAFCLCLSHLQLQTGNCHSEGISLSFLGWRNETITRHEDAHRPKRNSGVITCRPHFLTPQICEKCFTEQRKWPNGHFVKCTVTLFSLLSS